MAKNSLTLVEAPQQKEYEPLKKLILGHADFKAATAKSRTFTRTRFMLAWIEVNNFVLSGEPIQKPTT